MVGRSGWRLSRLRASSSRPTSRVDQLRGGEESDVWLLKRPDHEAPVQKSVELFAAGLREKRTGVTGRKIARVGPLSGLTRLHADRIGRAPFRRREGGVPHSLEVARLSHAHETAH